MTHTPPPTQDDLAAGRYLDALVSIQLKLRERAFSSSIAAAWEAVDCLVPRDWYFNLSVGGRELDTDPVWEARFSHYPNPEEEAETFTALAHTPALAICRAALKAVSA